MEKQARFAIIGCGRIAQTHIRALAMTSSATLVAVCDIVEEKARTAAEKYSIPAYYNDMETMIKAEKPDVVCICVPSGHHAECVMRAARLGVNILCEKPLDVSPEKINEMLRVVKECGVKLGGIFQRRNCEAVQIAKKVIEEGKLGKLVIASASLKYFRDQAYYDVDAWRGTKALDGGCLSNQCIHGIDLLQYLGGEIKSVTAKCATLARDIECEDTAVATVEFAHGGLGVIETATTVNPGQDTIIYLHGTEGTIVLGGDGFLQWELGDGSKMPEVSNNMGGPNCAYAWDNLHAMMIEDMARAVLDDREPMIGGADARRAVDIVAAIVKASETGKAVTVEYH